MTAATTRSLDFSVMWLLEKGSTLEMMWDYGSNTWRVSWITGGAIVYRIGRSLRFVLNELVEEFDAPGLRLTDGRPVGEVEMQHMWSESDRRHNG